MGKFEHPRSNEAFGIEKPLNKKQLRSRRNREKTTRSLAGQTVPPPRIDFRNEDQAAGSYPDVGLMWSAYLDQIP